MTSSSRNSSSRIIHENNGTCERVGKEVANGNNDNNNNNNNNNSNNNNNNNNNSNNNKGDMSPASDSATRELPTRSLSITNPYVTKEIQATNDVTVAIDTASKTSDIATSPINNTDCRTSVLTSPSSPTTSSEKSDVSISGGSPLRCKKSDPDLKSTSVLYQVHKSALYPSNFNPFPYRNNSNSKVRPVPPAGK